MLQKNHEYIVCIDSDGCAIDSMTLKHRECFGPELVRVWELENNKDEILKIWNEMNLYSLTRGINRFKGLACALKYAQEKGYIRRNLAPLEEWTKTASVLSAASLKKEIERSKDKEKMILEEALRWSDSVNWHIETLSADKKGSFPGVRKALEKIKKNADLAVVSAANKKAVEDEWTYNGLANFADVFLTQENGGKADCLKGLKNAGYEKNHILMIGDAAGDMESAEKADVLFYPVVVGREEESWEHFTASIIDLFLTERYNDDISDQCKKIFLDNLKG